MRALYIQELKVQNEYVLSGDILHHIVNVVRISKDDELLLLNGLGLKVLTTASEVAKRKVSLTFKSSENSVQDNSLDIVLGMPKRDALEVCLKEAVELGISTIYLVKSDYSQMKFMDEDRVQNLLVSALEQSNAPFIPKVVHCSWSEMNYDKYKAVVMMDSQIEDKNVPPLEKAINGPILLVVGPEGGFSSDERSHLHSLKNVSILKLPTPILRTPTALAAGAGIVWQLLLK